MKNHFTRRLLLWAVLIFNWFYAFPQQDPGEVNDAGLMEASAERKEAEPDDDADQQDLETLKLHPLDLNQAGAEALYSLHRLDALQISNFLIYRRLLGSLLSLHELQAVPGWDIAMIRELLPYIKVGRDESLSSALKERWRGGDASLLIRMGQVLEKSKGYDPSATTAYYLGSPQKIFFRYAYNYKQVLQYGISGSKDAGEPFLRGAQRAGFDFYSFHFFLRNTGMIKELALGDFTVNLGQGLIQWQSIAFTKGGDVMGIKRQAAQLKPYQAAGEFNFHRGFSISLKKRNWNTTFFFSSQKISSNPAADTTGRENIFTSFENGGYHRTANEIADRNNNRQLSAGGSIHFLKNHLSLDMNFIYFHFALAFQKKEEPYNLYSFKGRTLSDASISYSYSLANLHLFGELAADRAHHPALVQGALISLGKDLDFSFLYRNISPAYQCLYADAFTENGSPVNERGLYAGLSFRPWNGLRLEVYYDLYSFPWLKYRVDGPSVGGDFSVQAFYQPNKNWYLRWAYKKETKELNGNPEGNRHSLVSATKQRWRMETAYQADRSLSIKSRMETVWYGLGEAKLQEGFLGSLGISFRSRAFSSSAGYVYFATPGYDTRIYLYEPDMQYNFSLPSFYGQGYHYYFNVYKKFKLQNSGKKEAVVHLSGSLRWSQTFYPEQESVGTGLDEIKGVRKSELRAQLIMNWE